MFTQSEKEQVDTIAHELGHTFGLRHFFANVSETAWPSQIFGEHKAFSIMNYGNQSELTTDDKDDLERLYQSVWNGELTNINGTPIHLVKPFHTIGGPV
jgi:predicted Zn-dependent protease